FEESFEGATLPTDWTFVNTHSSPDANWHLNTSDGNDGNNAIEVLYWDYNMMDEWAITPQIDLSAYSGQEITLSFDFFTSYYWMVSPFDGADLLVKISTDGGTTWTELWNEHDYGTFDSFIWYTESLSLTSYAGESNVKIAFQ